MWLVVTDENERWTGIVVYVSVLRDDDGERMAPSDRSNTFHSTF